MKGNKPIRVENMDYVDQIKALKDRYISNRLKAVIAVNSSMLEFYYSIGHDISNSSNENKYGSSFYENLSRDLKRKIPNVKSFSATNLKYTRYFYELYFPHFQNRQQPVDDFSEAQSTFVYDSLETLHSNYKQVKRRYSKSCIFCETNHRE